MIYSQEVSNMTCIAKEVNHGPAPIPEEGKWVQAKEIKERRAHYPYCIQLVFNQIEPILVGIGG